MQSDGEEIRNDDQAIKSGLGRFHHPTNQVGRPAVQKRARTYGKGPAAAILCANSCTPRLASSTGLPCANNKIPVIIHRLRRFLRLDKLRAAANRQALLLAVPEHVVWDHARSLRSTCSAWNGIFPPLVLASLASLRNLCNLRIVVPNEALVLKRARAEVQEQSNFVA